MRITKLFLSIAVTVATTVAVADPACNARKNVGRNAPTAFKIAKSSNGLPVLNTQTGSTTGGNQ